MLIRGWYCFRLLAPHSGGEIEGYHEWWFPGKKTGRDAIGRENNGGMHIWHVLECNNPECTGRAIIRESDLLEAIPLGVIKP